MKAAYMSKQADISEMLCRVLWSLFSQTAVTPYFVLISQ